MHKCYIRIFHPLRYLLDVRCSCELTHGLLFMCITFQTLIHSGRALKHVTYLHVTYRMVSFWTLTAMPQSNSVDESIAVLAVIQWVKYKLSFNCHF